MQRVMILGQPGAGKSTLVRAMGGITGLPVFHIDHIHWKAGWVERSRPEKTALCHDIHVQDRWIFEGGHSLTWPERLARADTLIWLDYPASLRLRRVIVRSRHYFGQTRPDLPEGCPEEQVPNSEFIGYIWRTRHSGRANIAATFARAQGQKPAIRLANDDAVVTYLAALRQNWVANTPE